MPGRAGECHRTSFPVIELPPYHKAARTTLIHSGGEMASTTVKLEREVPESRVQATACHLAVTNMSATKTTALSD